MAAEIIAITNQKGGVGKTTTALNTAAALAKAGKSVLLIDLDPQAHCGIGLGIDVHALTLHSGTILLQRGVTCENAIQPTNLINFDLIPAHPELSKIERELFQKRGREFILQKALRKIDDYEFILIDTPPNLGLLTENALCAAEWVLIPCQMSYYAIEGTFALIEILDQIQGDLDHAVAVLGIVPTFYDKRTRTSPQIVRELKEYFGELVFEQLIRTNVRLNEAQKNHQLIFEYDPDSAGAQDYWLLSQELLERLARNTRSGCS